MNVLDAFLHDPLVEWEDEKRKLVSEILSCLFPYNIFWHSRSGNQRNETKLNLLWT